MGFIQYTRVTNGKSQVPGSSARWRARGNRAPHSPRDLRPGLAASVGFGFCLGIWVSAITVKRAIRDLQTVGLVRFVPGFATIVHRRQRFIRDLDLGVGSPENAKRLGQEASIKLVSVAHQ
jgi:hypothetical protein